MNIRIERITRDIENFSIISKAPEVICPDDQFRVFPGSLGTAYYGESTENSKKKEKFVEVKIEGDLAYVNAVFQTNYTSTEQLTEKRYLNESQTIQGRTVCNEICVDCEGAGFTGVKWDHGWYTAFQETYEVIEDWRYAKVYEPGLGYRLVNCCENLLFYKVCFPYVANSLSKTEGYWLKGSGYGITMDEACAIQSEIPTEGQNPSPFKLHKHETFHTPETAIFEDELGNPIFPLLVNIERDPIAKKIQICPE